MAKSKTELQEDLTKAQAATAKAQADYVAVLGAFNKAASKRDATPEDLAKLPGLRKKRDDAATALDTARDKQQAAQAAYDAAP